VCNLVENLFSTLILGSVFNDYVIFYRDRQLLIKWWKSQLTRKIRWSCWHSVAWRCLSSHSDEVGQWSLQTHDRESLHAQPIPNTHTNTHTDRHTYRQTSLKEVKSHQWLRMSINRSLTKWVSSLVTHWHMTGSVLSLIIIRHDVTHLNATVAILVSLLSTNQYH